jgi:hypothetical protein
MILHEINLSQEDINRTSRTMSHWLNVAKALYDSVDEQFILKMLYVELNTRSRYYVVQRIYAHYNSVRRRRELEEIRKWSPRKIQKSISEITSPSSVESL